MMHVWFLRKLLMSLIARLMTWHLFGVNGLRWRSGMSKFTVHSRLASCAQPDV